MCGWHRSQEGAGPLVSIDAELGQTSPGHSSVGSSDNEGKCGYGCLNTAQNSWDHGRQ